jgi:hypothetical protein
MLELVRRRRWTAALVTGAVALTAVVTFLATRSTATPDLPAISPERLVTSAIRAAERNEPISGMASLHLDLGLPDLPSTSGVTPTGPLGVLTTLAGDHDLRVWKSADGVRVAELLPAAERAIFASRTTGVWLWDSTDLSAYHVLPPGLHDGPTVGPAPRLDPSSLAAKAVAAITPTTAVSVGTARMVAGRPAYALVLEPRTDQTLVGSVEVDIDAVTRRALRVAVTPRGGTAPAVESAFTSVSFDPIDPSTFEFTPPPGSHVSDLDLGRGHAPPHVDGGEGDGPSVTDVRHFGQGWAAIVAVHIKSLKSVHGTESIDQITSLLPYSGPLLSVRLSQRADGTVWLLAGMVPQSSLERVVQRLP